MTKYIRRCNITYSTQMKSDTSILINSLLTLTDSYKIGHWKMVQNGTQNIYSYFESRNGAIYPFTLFFGLQFYLKKYLEGPVVTQEAINAADVFFKSHFMGSDHFNREMWEYILNEHKGLLPIKIKAVPEGTCVNISNVLFTVEVTDEKLKKDSTALLAPLTNVLESLLTHVWAASNVATISKNIRNIFEEQFKISVPKEDHWMLDYMLHDFGFRGVSSVDSAGMGGAGHLISFKGTDTISAILYAQNYYNTIETLGHSVAATEHMVMTQLGKEGEFDVLESVMAEFPTGILSVVADSYDIENFVNTIGTERFKNKILNRDGKFVVRPDSPRFDGDKPEDQILWIVETLAEDFGFSTNRIGFKKLNSKVGVLYGDGLSPAEIETCIKHLVNNGWDASTCVYGMGGGLLQKHNRDTQRNAFKCSSIKRNDQEFEVFKKPKDKTKASKAGKLKLVYNKGNFKTEKVENNDFTFDCLETVFLNGKIVKEYTFEEVKQNALK